ncbi:MAG: copper resistance protein NlpE N-terminal domain-containing protein [Bacteroidetes bacterium]|nr:copper resistance protein NlpE N-terminal domain-containing protein [Bacteroidota bacterium]
MQKLFVSAGIALLIVAHSSCSELTEKSNSRPLQDSSAVADTSWKTYTGVIPCADCPGIAMELKIKDAFTIESYQFELKETYLEAENGKDKSYVSKGKYNFWRGNSTDPDATILVLNDDSADQAKRFFLKVSENELKVVNNKGDTASSNLNFSLLRTSK